MKKHHKIILALPLSAALYTIALAVFDDPTKLPSSNDNNYQYEDQYQSDNPSKEKKDLDLQLIVLDSTPSAHSSKRITIMSTNAKDGLTVPILGYPKQKNAAGKVQEQYDNGILEGTRMETPTPFTQFLDNEDFFYVDINELNNLQDIIKSEFTLLPRLKPDNDTYKVTTPKSWVTANDSPYLKHLYMPENSMVAAIYDSVKIPALQVVILQNVTGEIISYCLIFDANVYNNSQQTDMNWQPKDNHSQPTIMSIPENHQQNQWEQVK